MTPSGQGVKVQMYLPERRLSEILRMGEEFYGGNTLRAQVEMGKKDGGEINETTYITLRIKMLLHHWSRQPNKLAVTDGKSIRQRSQSLRKVSDGEDCGRPGEGRLTRIAMRHGRVRDLSLRGKIAKPLCGRAGQSIAASGRPPKEQDTLGIFWLGSGTVDFINSLEPPP
uniref:Uncharacterized protein n=1 Tax=Vespula pensylvanica TaxID=30213 RepID=A0A834NKB2_VESPE|nr:hypothetical protein H0235_013250 [Vespula pensylvanica]